MSKKRELNDISEELKHKYPDQVFDFTGYTNTSSKIRVLDPIYGEWYPSVHNLLLKTLVCRKRYEAERIGKRVLNISEVKKRIWEVYGNLVEIDENTYTQMGKRCKFVDKEYGEFFTSPRHVMNGHGHRSRGILKFSKSQQLDIDELEKRIKEVHGDNVAIDRDTYNGLYRKARFIHREYGEWLTLPKNVVKGSSHPQGIRNKAVGTCMTKYGVCHPMQSYSIHRRSVRSRWKTIDVEHWKTGNVITCTSSYEYAIVRHMNDKRINYEWQIKFELPDNMIYFVDMYVTDENRYVEIKGFFWNEKSKMKWDMFHNMYDNSWIWYGKDVSNIVGKSIYRMKKEFDHDYEEVRRSMG
jgi:hypothetical protein